MERTDVGGLRLSRREPPDKWHYHDWLRDTSIWTIRDHGGSWGWRKLLRLRPFLGSSVDYHIGNRASFYIWQDPWHHLGPLIERFPRGPRLLGINKSTKLIYVISEGEWHWPPITDFECLEITHTLPQICGGANRVVWRFDKGQPTTQARYKLFDPPGPKVGWSSLLSGSLKVPRHAFILWLAILGKLPTTDKPWLSHLGACILCDEGSTETHSHLFFQCRFSRQCLIEIRRRIRFQWPNKDWETNIEWATKKWRGKHIVNIAYRTLLAACVYHIWRERNLRRFEHTERTPNTIAGEWQWPTITDFECLEITHNLPLIFGGEDRVVWRCDEGQPTTQALYRLFDHSEPKVGWSSLLSGSLKIPRHSFILWLAILGKLPTTDKPWLSHLGVCILCDEGATESHPHLFFRCRFSRQCLYEIRRRIRFHWPNRDWATDIEWATQKWRGKHIINGAYRTLLASCVYHIWRERNLRRFEHTERTPATLSILIIDDVRQRILSVDLASSVSTRALYRLWRIPLVEGETI
ncbi:UNVERIFIED_CONTAM: hypothetical protein Sindi_2904200 [Sesamum indicum]